MSAVAGSCVLRPATHADRDAIAAIWHASASLPGVGRAVMPSEAELRGEVYEQFDTRWVVTVAVDGARVIGFVAVNPRDRILAELFLLPDAIGGGVGRLLLDHAKAAMPDGFTLFTRPANVRARRFYERAGLAFLRDGTHPRTGEPVVHYEWKGR